MNLSLFVNKHIPPSSLLNVCCPPVLRIHIVLLLFFEKKPQKLAILDFPFTAKMRKMEKY